MILILQPEAVPESPVFADLAERLDALPGIQWRVHQEKGAQQVLTEIYLIGQTAALEEAEMAVLPGVDRVVRVSESYRILGRHRDDGRPSEFIYNGVQFGQDTLHVLA
ncbi:MAG: 3-deoxy-7-phosphoheptulonate synthase, partial [Candidatus Macondimonas sp.]